MDRNRKFLKLLSTCTALVILIGCIHDKKNQKENIYDLPTVSISLDKAVGKYYHIPSGNDNDYPNYKTYKLEKGDSIILKINTDSTFIFNHFYYDKMVKLDNYRGKVSKDLRDLSNILIRAPKDAIFDGQGFKMSKNDLYFYFQVNMENFDSYDYCIFYKKLK